MTAGMAQAPARHDFSPRRVVAGAPPGRTAAFAAAWVIFVSSGVLAGIEVVAPGVSSALLLPSYAYILWTLARRGGAVATAAWRAPLVLGFVAFCFLSSLWSIDASTTLAESARLSVHCLTAICVVVWLGFERALETLARMLAIGCALSLLAWFVPEISRGSYGDFRGVFQQKNILGFAAAIVTLYYVYRLAFFPPAIRALAAVLVGAGNVVLTSSASSLVIVAIGCAFLLACRLLSLGRPLTATTLVALLAGLALAGLAASTLADQIFGLLGRDATLTGRTQLWEIGNTLAADKPYLGYGYQVLANESGPMAQYMVQRVGDYALQFHNSLLNIRFQLGLAGMALNLLSLLGVFLAALRELKAPGGRNMAAIIAALGLCLTLQSFTESTFGAPRSVQTFVLVLILLRPTERRRAEARRQAYGPTVTTTRRLAAPLPKRLVSPAPLAVPAPKAGLFSFR